MQENQHGEFDDLICMDCVACSPSWNGDFYCKVKDIIMSLKKLGKEVNSKYLRCQGIESSNILPDCPENFQEILTSISSEV